MTVIRSALDALPFNFSAGPAALPISLKEKLKEEIDKPLSMFERSHKCLDIEELWVRSCQQLRSLLEIPERFELLLMPGGARLQLSAFFLNIRAVKRAGYLMTGYWARWAFKEAQRMQQPAEPLLCYQDAWEGLGLDLLYYCDNETLAGSYFQLKERAGVQCVVADMTSSFLCHRVNFDLHDVIIVGCQKNLGLAGCSLILYDKNHIQPHLLCPSALNYLHQTQMNNQATTPSVLHMWLLSAQLAWIEERGFEWLMLKRQHIAQAFYDFFDRSLIFKNQIAKQWRSVITITFNLRSAKSCLRKNFEALLEEQGFFYLKAHPNFSDGYRISLYNAILEQEVDRLLYFLVAFEDGCHE